MAIAMRDLEIRGAGNMLGAEQHGHIEAVGFEMYVRLLEEAAKELRGVKAEETIDVRIDLPVDAYLPASYIDREPLRLAAYRRIAEIGHAGRRRRRRRRAARPVRPAPGARPGAARRRAPARRPARRTASTTCRSRRTSCTDASRSCAPSASTPDERARLRSRAPARRDVRSDRDAAAAGARRATTLDLVAWLRDDGPWTVRTRDTVPADS